MALFEIEQRVVLVNGASFTEIKLDGVTEVLYLVNTILEIERNLMVSIFIGGRTDVDGRLLHAVIKPWKDGTICFNGHFLAFEGVCRGDISGFAGIVLIASNKCN
jgi:hypothetical protein